MTTPPSLLCLNMDKQLYMKKTKEIVYSTIVMSDGSRYKATNCYEDENGKIVVEYEEVKDD